MLVCWKKKNSVKDACRNIVILEYLRLVVHIFFQNLHPIRGSLNKFPDFFRRDTFIDSTHKKL